MFNKIISQIILYLSSFAKNLHGFSGGFKIPTANYNWLTISFFVFAILIIAFSLGRSRMLLALVGLYAAAFLEPIFPFFNLLHKYFLKYPEYFLHLALFFVFYILVILVLNNSILKTQLSVSRQSVIYILFVAFLEIGFMFSILSTYLPAEIIKRFPSNLAVYFSTKNARFVWALVPVLALIFASEKKHRQKQNI